MPKENLQVATSLKGIILMIVAALSTAVGQLFWKLSEGGLNLELIVGFALYGMGAVLMIVAFRFGELSVLHPLLSVGYVFSTILGFSFLGEVITLPALGGILLIIIGVALIGGGSD
ncbi:EamA/RhaT family transporter [Bacillus tianshenii]|uniref:EamA/RhaT family transporter n=1 Tax=Sutcliffiella tianshenii TaxID=1463404 RepID=UPI001CD5BA30|nr:EamA/RhaT family transporter [Bacillus tianshenii]MCA1320496.1 EamA/RhaT family transporter [Bacillus tianshenii]